MERLVRDSLRELENLVRICSHAVSESREKHDMEYDAKEKLKQIANAIHDHPLALNRSVDKVYDFQAVEEVVRQLRSVPASMDLNTLLKFLVDMKYQAGTRIGKHVIFGVHARAFDHNCLLDVDHRWGMEKALQREFLSVSGYVDWMLFELEEDVDMWCRRDTKYVAPHCSVLDSSPCQKFRVISKLREEEFVIAPRDPRFFDMLTGRVTKDPADFTEQCCLLFKNVFSGFRDWLKIQLTASSGSDRQDLIRTWNAHHDSPEFWAGVWSAVLNGDRNFKHRESPGSGRTPGDLIALYHRELTAIKMEAIELINSITLPDFRATWDDLDSLFVVESCTDFNEECYQWFRDCMHVVTSREREFATYFLLFDDLLGRRLPPPNISPEKRRKLYKPFRLGLAPDGFWRVARTFEVFGRRPEEVVELVENKLVSIDRLSILSPLEFIDNKADPMDHTILANNLTLKLLTHLKVLALFGTPNYFQIFFQSKSREPLLTQLMASILEHDFLALLIQRLPAEGEEDIVPHVDHIKPIAVQELLHTQSINWRGSPDSPAVKCLQVWQACLVNTDFGTGWIGLPSIQSATFLKALGEPDRNRHDGCIRLGCFVYKENVCEMELNQSEPFEAFIRGVGFCDERSVLIPVCAAVTEDAVIAASCMLESFRWTTKVSARKGLSCELKTRPLKKPKLRNE